jgi:uncharacterized membrane protein YraQ (UPF0718 family)
MQSRRTRTDLAILIFLLVIVLAAYISSFYITKISGIGLNNFVSTVRLLIDKLFKPVILATLLSSVFSYVFPKKYTSYILAGSGFRPILNSLWIGLFSQNCSSQNLKVALIQYRSGLSLGATMTYLLMSPFNSFSTVFILFSLFGVKKALLFFVSLILVAFLLGVLADLLQYYKVFAKSVTVSRRNPNFSLQAELKQDLQKLIHEISNKKNLLLHCRNIISDIYIYSIFLIKWLLIGIVFAGILSGALTEELFFLIFSNSLRSQLLALLLSSFLAIWGLATIILTFLFYHMTGGFGTAFVFLTGSVLWSYFRSGDLKKVLGRKETIYFMFVSVLSFFIVGFVLN